MKKLERNTDKFELHDPVKIVQFGEGNFLRAFIDWIFDILNEQGKFNGAISIVQPIENGLCDLINKQNGLYHVFTQGITKGKLKEEIRLVQSVKNCINPYTDFSDYMELAVTDSLEFIISNTTEAGIQYTEEELIEGKISNSFPGKLTQFLYKRFTFFKGDKNKGLIILPCELIDHNADELKYCINQYIDSWNLENDFKEWVNTSNSFYNTLVDRIVTGYPKNSIDEYRKKAGYDDHLMVSAEQYYLWVIENNDNTRLHNLFSNSKLNVLLVDNLQPFRKRKVRILNGAHTAMVPVGLLNGNKTVQETVEQTFTKDFVKEIIYNEICPVLDFPEDEIKEYADIIISRFKNPSIVHQLSSIALNSISKFKVRVLPSIIDYYNLFNKLPSGLVFSFTALIIFYKGDGMPVNDSEEIKEYFKDLWKNNDKERLVLKVLKNTSFWEKDLTSISDLKESVLKALTLTDDKGIENAWKEFKDYDKYL